MHWFLRAPSIELCHLFITLSNPSVLPAKLRKLHFVPCEVSEGLDLTFSTEVWDPK